MCLLSVQSEGKLLVILFVLSRSNNSLELDAHGDDVTDGRRLGAGDRAR